MKPETADQIMTRLLKEKIAEDEARTVTQDQVDARARFLLGWAKSATISKWAEGSTFYKKGKLMSKLDPAMVRGLLASGYAIGTVRSFTMNAAKIKAIK